MTGARPLWLATLGWGSDPWWDVTGRTARRRARRRVVDIALGIAVAVLLVSMSGHGARAAGVSVNLDQWAPLEGAWQNGNLNGNNARFPEGGIVPFRLAIEGLAPGPHTIRINYDVTAGGHKAYDFLATWNAWTSPNPCGPGGAVSSLCPALPSPSSAAIPSDRFVMDGLSVTAAEVYSGTPRRITIWGGTITTISAPAHAGPTSGNSSGDITVRFTSTGAAVLLAWGGHLAQSAFWNLAAGGERDGAGEVSGAPWHMRTLQLDGSGNRNQDRSIQPSAIVGELPPAALAPRDPAGPAPGPASNPAAPAAPRIAAPRVPGSGAAVPTVPPTTTGPTADVAEGASAGPWVAALVAMLLGLSMTMRRRTRA